MPMLRRVQPRTSDSEDRLSALHDELILLIVRRLDTRTALSMAVLARRWVHIPRELSALDFRVSDILPPEYERTVGLRQRNLPHDATLAGILDGLKVQCEMDTMTSLANGITSFLEADGGLERQVKTLRLEFFQTYDSIYVDRLINVAVSAWGVEDLEVVVRRSFGVDQSLTYNIPRNCLNLRSRLRSLTLGKYCALPLLDSYNTLAKLVLRDMSSSTPVDVYERLFKDCPGLQVLHLMTCCCAHNTLVVDAPHSHIRELVIDECSFLVIELRDLPMLVRLACCITNTSNILFGLVPSLTDTNLSFSLEDDSIAARGRDEFDSFLGNSPTMANLVIRFIGRRRWMRASHPERKLPNLKRLLVADMPSNWDIAWTRGLLMASTFLEVLHIHVPQSETEPDCLRGMNWLKSRNEHRHHHLKELVVIGYTQRSIWLLKYVVRVCTSLQRVVLLKDGHVLYNGLWEWRMVGQQTCPWSNDEKMVVRRMMNIFGLMPLPELILG
uniref:At1g61320/AtMIF1 LRR domain-containing protein n=1 Tax=Hordeum vulgare subsp. vulgare TaxID=112509 RepID=A0A8I6WP37_HORVV